MQFGSGVCRNSGRSVGESSMEHDAEIDYDNEHRVAEHEHDEVDPKLRNRQNNAVHLSGRADV